MNFELRTREEILDKKNLITAEQNWRNNDDPIKDDELAELHWELDN